MPGWIRGKDTYSFSSCFPVVTSTLFDTSSQGTKYLAARHIFVINEVLNRGIEKTCLSECPAFAEAR